MVLVTRARARSRPPSCTSTLRRTAPFTPASSSDVTWNLRTFASGWLVGLDKSSREPHTTERKVISMPVLFYWFVFYSWERRRRAISDVRSLLFGFSNFPFPKLDNLVEAIGLLIDHERGKKKGKSTTCKQTVSMTTRKHSTFGLWFLFLKSV